MYGLTRATTTLIGAALAGFLIWLAVEVSLPLEENGFFTAGEYWASMGLVAAAGFVLALSQLLGGWTKWGRPRVSRPVFLIAFLPVLVVTMWVVLADQPANDEWLQGNILDWSDDIGIGGLVEDLRLVSPLFVLGAGVVLGFTFDTSGPSVPSTEPAIAAPPAQEQVVEHRDVDADSETQVVEPPPREREPD